MSDSPLIYLLYYKISFCCNWSQYFCPSKVMDCPSVNAITGFGGDFWGLFLGGEGVLLLLVFFFCKMIWIKKSLRNIFFQSGLCLLCWRNLIHILLINWSVCKKYTNKNIKIMLLCLGFNFLNKNVTWNLETLMTQLLSLSRCIVQQSIYFLHTKEKSINAISTEFYFKPRYKNRKTIVWLSSYMVRNHPIITNLHKSHSKRRKEANHCRIQMWSHRKLTEQFNHTIQCQRTKELGTVSTIFCHVFLKTSQTIEMSHLFTQEYP